MSPSEQLRSQIHDYVLANFMFDANEIDLDMSLTAAGVLDSMGVLEMVLFVEESLGVAVADEEVLPEHFDTVNALAAFVESKTAPLLAAATH
jgi:acyl carrier protein